MLRERPVASNEITFWEDFCPMAVSLTDPPIRYGRFKNIQTVRNEAAWANKLKHRFRVFLTYRSFRRAD